MKKAGDLLSSFLDARILSGAHEYSALFSAWESIAGETIAAHSRIVELERAVLQIEADHPGWIQILQTKQAYLLERLRARFPQLPISGISFRLMRDRQDPPHQKPESVTQSTEQIPPVFVEQSQYETIKDEPFRSLLQRLERSITDRDKNH